MQDLDRVADVVRGIAGAQGCAVVALSGGVDSAVVAAAAKAALGQGAEPVTVASELTPRRELMAAHAVAGYLGLTLRVAPLRVLELDEVRANGPQRCYWCKRAVFGALGAVGPGPRPVAVLDGTTADDDPQRPGRRAAAELGVHSPLAAAGLDKADVRALAAALGLPNAAHAPESCLATRFIEGDPLVEEALRRVEALEDGLLALGLWGVRARPEAETLQVALPPGQDPEPHADAVAALARRAGFTAVRYTVRVP